MAGISHGRGVRAPIFRMQSGANALKTAEAGATEFAGEQARGLWAKRLNLIGKRQGWGGVRVEGCRSCGVAAVDSGPTVATLAKCQQQHSCTNKRGYTGVSPMYGPWVSMRHCAGGCASSGGI